jgi:hypothetical protein
LNEPKYNFHNQAVHSGTKKLQRCIKRVAHDAQRECGACGAHNYACARETTYPHTAITTRMRKDICKYFASLTAAPITKSLQGILLGLSMAYTMKHLSAPHTRSITLKWACGMKSSVCDNYTSTCTPLCTAPTWSKSVFCFAQFTLFCFAVRQPCE